jgi:hypothetical protein
MADYSQSLYMKDQIHRQTLIALNAHGEKYPESILRIMKDQVHE